MKRQLLIGAVAVAALLGSLVAAASTAALRDEHLRGYVDATQNQNLPFRIPRLGVNVELAQYTPDERRAQVALMQQAGMTWLRQPVRWNDVEPQRGSYNWSAVDAIVETTASFPDLQLVAVLVNAPDWAHPNDAGNITAPPDDPADFARFARAFAERYGHAIDHYQVWDEPNLTTGWGMREPRAADYAALLRAGYDAIHAADEGATVISAALAPTTETGPDNISDSLYLEDLYALGAGDSMDAAAAKPYGFSLPPDDRRVENSVLNFSRMIALREVMVRHGDGTAALWASNWGWNSLPDTWTGAPSIWGSVSADEQTAYTLDALNRADREFPWLGGMTLYHWQPNAPLNDPVWGFSLLDPDENPTPLLTALMGRSEPPAAQDGLYAAANPYTEYSGVWTFGALGADIGWVQDSQLAFDFTGSAVALLLRQDDYVAYLYPTIDGKPANALPHDSAGNAYLLLTSGSLEPERNLIPVARDLAPGAHTLRIVTDRGYDRWALAGFAVSSGDLAAPYNDQIRVALITAVTAAVSTVVTAWFVDWGRVLRPLSGVWNRLNDTAQLAISAVTSIALLVGMLLTWGDSMPAIFRREPVQLGLAALSAGLLYLEPGVILSIAAALALFVMFYHRLDMALALVLFWSPFFLFPVELYRFAFPLAELLLLIAGAAWTLWMLAQWGRARQTTVSQFAGAGSGIRIRLSALDYGVLAWLVIALVSLAWAERRAPAVTELRVMIVEPVIFYAILRTHVRDRQALIRLVDALLLAGVVVAVIGFWLFVRGEAVITAEEGARRLASVYGSPNNVGLFLGRCMPFALAYALLAVDRRRRVAALIALGVMALAVLLTQSAGALFVGVPASMVAVLLLAFRRRAWLPIGALVGVGAAAGALALQSARFSRILDLTQGTNFYRIRVWQSAVNIISDHPLTGLGLDQFLYAFRDQYILPDAWQEPNLSHPHNWLLDFWVRLGVVGVLVFLWIQAAFWRAAIRCYRAYRNGDVVLLALCVGMMGSMVNLLAHGLVDNSVYVHDLTYVFVLLLGLCGSLTNMRAIDASEETMV